uniref:SXP/RAL-2 family protein Ani s 5-like cation-binding domain-containing protein n=1 Tax=Ditylenchus dipsaci TaxID=166011 RepID=A0A915D5W0_9BILA
MGLLPQTLASLLIVLLISLQAPNFGGSQVVAPTSSQSNEGPEHNSPEATDKPRSNSLEHTDKPGVHSVEDGDDVPPKKVIGNNPLSRLHNDNGFGAIHGDLGEKSPPKNHPDNRPFVAATDVSENDSQESGLRKKREANPEDVREFYNLTKISQQAMVELLDVLNSTQKWQLIRIVSNVSLSKNQIEQQADAWVSNQGSAIQEAYELYKQTLQALSTEMQVIHSQIAQNLSVEAKKVDADLIAILTNNDLNMLEQCEEARAVLANTTQQVKHELETAFGPLPGSYYGHRRGGAGGRGHNHRGHQRRFGGNSQGASNRGGRGGRLMGGGTNNNYNSQRGYGGGFEGGPQNFEGQPSGRFGGPAGFNGGRQQGSGFVAGQTDWALQGNGGYGGAQPRGYAPAENSYY